jgi:hypothetical protein
MSGLMNLLALLGDPWLVIVLLAGAMIALEAERWWTRRRRRQRRGVGAPAYALDGLSGVSAALAAASALALFFRGLIAALVFAGELLDWAGNQISGILWLPAALGSVVVLGALAVAFARGWLRLHRRAERRGDSRRLGEPADMSDTLAPAASAANVLAPQLPPGQVEQPAPAALLAPRRETAVDAGPQIAVQPAIVVAPPQMAASRSTLSFLPDARAEEPIEGLASVSMIGQRRPHVAASPPRSFLPSTSAPAPRRSRLPLALVALTVVALAGAAFFFRPQLAELLPGFSAQTSYATAPVARSAPTSAPGSGPAAPTPAPALSGQVKSDVLNLRAGPGTDQQVIATLRRGTRVLLLNETQTIAGRTWVKVRAGEQVGWVSQEFLE